MSIKNISVSIKLIKLRIENIKNYLKRCPEYIKDDMCMDAIVKNLIEIGEESKKINDQLLEKKGEWDEIISDGYNLRISLTHYYSSIPNFRIEKYIEKNFPKFIEKINELEKEFEENI